MKKNTDVSPSTIAKITAVVYLILIVCAGFSQGYVLESMVVWGDAATTANNIITNKSLFKIGYTLFLIEMSCQVAIAVLLLLLLKPAGSKMATVAVYFGVAGATVKTVSILFYIAAFFILTNAAYLNEFTPAQIKALAYLMFDLKAYCAAVSLVFIGISTILFGYLMIKSTFMPKMLGYLTVVAGVGWMSFLSPELGFMLFDAVGLISLIGVFALIYWFLRFGVDDEKWRLKAQQLS